MGFSQNEFIGAGGVVPSLGFTLGQPNFDLPGGANLGSHNGLGPLGGFQLGYNYQVPSAPIVVGIEGEFSFANLKGDNQTSLSRAINLVSPNFPCNDGQQLEVFGEAAGQVRLSSQVKDIAAITGRFGVTSGPEDRTLWYVKGGGAWAKTDYQGQLSIGAMGCGATFQVGLPGSIGGPTCVAVNRDGSANGDSSRWGWTVGTGVEWGLFNNWSTKIEYDFYDFGHHNVDLTTEGGSIVGVNVKQQIHAIKVGLNYRFF